MAIRQQFPQAPTSPLTDDSGKITVAWHAFLTSLWSRTGGAQGDVSTILDSLGNPLPGVTLFRGPSVWQYLTIGSSGQLYTTSPSHFPQWEALSSLLDRIIGSATGSMIYRNGSQWVALPVGADGTALLAFGAVPTWTPQMPVTSGTVIAPASTTSATEVMMGLGGSVGFFITPIRTGRVNATIAGTFQNNANNAGVNISGRYGVGAAPANGVAFTGTQWSTTQHFPEGTKDIFAFSVVGNISGLALNTQVWFDVSIAATTAGTASVADVQGLLYEL
jgi:hypothetical protein